MMVFTNNTVRQQVTCNVAKTQNVAQRTPLERLSSSLSAEALTGHAAAFGAGGGAVRQRHDCLAHLHILATSLIRQPKDSH